MKKFGIEDILNYYSSAIKDSKVRVGIENEFFCVDNFGNPLQYIELNRILNKFITNYNYVNKNGDTNNIFEITRGNEIISLEPGGQIEYSSPPEIQMLNCEHYLMNFLDELECIVSSLGNINIVSRGIIPKYGSVNVEIIPKERYRYLSTYLKDKGALSLDMMKYTASIHINIDYLSEEDAMDCFKTIMSISLIVSCYFSNSKAIVNNIEYVNFRREVWNNTDKSRCGVIFDVIYEDWNFEKYVNFILEKPLIYIYRNGNFIFLNGKISFWQFIKHGYGEYTANLDDYLLHLNSIFHDARIKRYIEIRSTDAQPFNLLFEPAYFWVKILSSKKLREKAQSLIGFANKFDFEKLSETIPMYGLDAKLGNIKIKDIADELFRLVMDNL